MNRVFILLFAIVFSAGSLIFDVIIFSTIAEQLSALSFAHTPGTVTSSRVNSRSSADQDYIAVQIEYLFSVQDQQYHGNLYRHVCLSPSYQEANSIVKRYPPGTPVEVFYNPGNPQDCVLHPGLDGSDLFQMAFITPFNMISLGCWIIALWPRLPASSPAGGIKLRVESHKTYARLTEFNVSKSVVKIGTFMATLTLLTFGSIFIVGTFQPSLIIMVIVWIIMVLATILISSSFAHWWTTEAESGKYDLVLDFFNRTLQLPLTSGRDKLVIIPMEKVYGAFVAIEEYKDPDGDPAYTYRPALRLEHKDGPIEKLTDWGYSGSGMKAQKFTTWLNEQLGTVHNCPPNNQIFPLLEVMNMNDYVKLYSRRP